LQEVSVPNDIVTVAKDRLPNCPRFHLILEVPQPELEAIASRSGGSVIQLKPGGLGGMDVVAVKKK
jgi:hypothetical protein